MLSDQKVRRPYKALHSYKNLIPRRAVSTVLLSHCHFPEPRQMSHIRSADAALPEQTLCSVWQTAPDCAQMLNAEMSRLRPRGYIFTAILYSWTCTESLQVKYLCLKVKWHWLSWELNLQPASIFYIEEISHGYDELEPMNTPPPTPNSSQSKAFPTHGVRTEIGARTIPA